MSDVLTVKQTFDKAIAVGEGKAGMPAFRAFALAVLAGAFIGFGGMMLLLVKADPSLSSAASALLAGLAFSLGLFAVVMAGGELFTGNNLMTLGMLSGKYSFKNLMRSWAIVYAGNLVGSVIVALLLHLCGFSQMAGGAVGEAIVSVAAAKCALSIPVMVARGVMCNILVCLAVWMSFAGHSTTDKLAATALPVTAFVACGFEHCVANMMLLPLGLMTVGGAASAVTIGGVAANILFVTLGNVLGGAGLFAGAYWLAFGKKDAPKHARNDY